MKFAIITHVIHNQTDNHFFGYGPYMREMDVWLKFVDEVIVVAPLAKVLPTAIDSPYQHDKIDFLEVPNFSFTSFKNNMKALYILPLVIWKVLIAMKNSDHIHLRCPGNVGLIGCIVQILFPSKTKTAKYAGNWDPESKQPWTYRFQKWILKNTFLTRNMQVLVYGEWQNQSKNIKSFFTASYPESAKKEVLQKNLNALIEFIFVGSLVEGKNPLYAIKLLQQLAENNHNVLLNIYGEGKERKALEKYIEENKLERMIVLRGNQNQETLKKAYQKSHFVILPSKSEGWPKAIAEGMFWGCVPLATNVSCVPFMIEYGKRGILLEMQIKEDLVQIEKIFSNPHKFNKMSSMASKWSHEYTIERFESEIEKLLVK